MDCAALYADAVGASPLEIDLEEQEIRRFNGAPPVPFHVDPFRRRCLLEGLDDIALTLLKMEHIDDFEKKRSALWPWVDGLGYQSGKGIHLGNNKDAMNW